MVVDVVQYGTIPGVNVTWLHVDRAEIYLKKKKKEKTNCPSKSISLIFSLKRTKLKYMILLKLEELEIESVE